MQADSRADPLEETLGKEAVGKKPLGRDRWEPRWKKLKAKAHAGERQAFACDEQIIAHSNMDKNERCPSECPFLTQDKIDTTYCTFRCVVKEDCTKYNAASTIADTEKFICRPPSIYACKEPTTTGEEACKVCNDYYILIYGMCLYKYMWVGHLIGLALVGLLVIIVLWVVDLATRPVTNVRGLEDGLKFRTGMKLLKPPEHWSDRPKPWPLLTNLHEALVGGPGLTLHFNFQVFIIAWSLGIAFIWMAFGYTVDETLFRIGTREFGTPYENCLIVAWGFEQQQSLMWTKVAFLIIVYLLSTIIVLGYSIYQLRTYQRLMYNNKTMRDYVATLSNIPSYTGQDRPEEELKAIVEEATGKKVVGVSVAWNYKAKEEEINWLIEQDLTKREQEKKMSPRSPYHANSMEESEEDVEIEVEAPQAVEAAEADLQMQQMNRPRGCCARRSGASPPSSPQAASSSGAAQQQRERDVEIIGRLPQQDEEEKEEKKSCCRNPMSAYRPKLLEFEAYLFATLDEGKFKELQQEERVKWLLEGLSATTEAFVVFETEDDRDAAVGKLSESGLDVKGEHCELEAAETEPETVIWQNFGNSTWCSRFVQILKGFGAILAALCVWTIVFYLPYAFAVMNFNYENGQQPGPIYSLAFTVVVVAGNAIMYEVCARIADSVGFHFQDERESCYMILYTTACMFNVLLDFVTTYYIARQIMIGLGFRTVDGRKLEDVASFQESFETYAMQRMLAENLYDYTVSTFSVPFFIEPFITIIGPLWAGMWFVGAHDQIVGREAELWLSAPPMELGRYADILLNMILSILIFYFPGGFTHTLFIGMALSHVWIYILDHTRVLKSMRRFCFASMKTDWWCQFMLGSCCALCLSCLVFKANCQGYGFCLEKWHLTAACTAAFIFHFVVHTLLLVHWVPRWGLKDEDLELAGVQKATDTYKELNKSTPCTWFSSNPVHCLRSKYIFGHKVPCGFSQVGREHLLEVNEAIGCHYAGKRVQVESFKFEPREMYRDVKTSFFEKVDALREKQGNSESEANEPLSTALGERTTRAQTLPGRLPAQ